MDRVRKLGRWAQTLWLGISSVLLVQAYLLQGTTEDSVARMEAAIDGQQALVRTHEAELTTRQTALDSCQAELTARVTRAEASLNSRNSRRARQRRQQDRLLEWRGILAPAQEH